MMTWTTCGSEDVRRLNIEYVQCFCVLKQKTPRADEEGIFSAHNFLVLISCVMAL